MKQAFLSAIASGGTKLISLVVVYYTVRWGVDYLGEERYGLWMTITSLIALMGLADLGINNSLVNITSDASGRDNLAIVKKETSNSIVGLTAIALIMIIISTIAYYRTDWGSLLNLKTELAISEAGPSILIFTIFFSLSLPMTIAQKILIGLQKGWIANIWIGVGQATALISFWYAIRNGEGLPNLILAVMAPPLLINIIGSILFFFNRKELMPKVSDISKNSLRALLSTGGLFFLIQIMSMAGVASDNIIIAHLLGANAVADFSVTQRLATIFAMYQLFISPMWPAFGEAISRGDTKWAGDVFIKGIYILLACSTLVAIIYFYYGELLIKLWTNGNITPSFSLVFGFCLYIIMSSVGGMVSAIMSTTKMLRSLAIIYTLASVISIALKITFINYYQSSSGAVWANVVSYTFIFIIPAFFIIRINLNKKDDASRQIT